MEQNIIRTRVRVVVLVALGAVLVALLAAIGAADAARYERGSSGEMVEQIQTHLKRWGFYDGDIDGIYGSGTEAAVRAFQESNGLGIDGICGQQTLAVLGINQHISGAMSDRENDLYLLSRMISAEARGEVYSGQVAVGAVILNRVAHASFPNSIAGVIYQPGAFSPVSDGAFDSVEITESARKAAQDALNGSDPTGGAIYFYNAGTAQDDFVFNRETVTVIGNHTFAK